MMTKKISETLKPYLIDLDLKESSHEAVLRELTRLIHGHQDVVNAEGFFQDLMAREKLESTCLGNGIAFPHARTDHVKNLIIIAGRSREGVKFENTDQPVKLLFIIGTPKRMVTDYLATVGALARLLKEESLRQKLMSTKTPQGFIGEISEAEART